MKLPLMLIFLSLSSQIKCMNAESMMRHLKTEEKQENPLGPLMDLRTVKKLKESGITKWDMRNPNNGNTIAHYCVGCNSWDPGLLPIFLQQIDVNAQNKKWKTPLMVLIENSPLYDALGLPSGSEKARKAYEKERKEAIENLVKKFSYLMQAGALLTGRNVSDEFGKTPIERLNGLIRIASSNPIVLKVYTLILAELKKTGQEKLLWKIPTKKAAL